MRKEQAEAARRRASTCEKMPTGPYDEYQAVGSPRWEAIPSHWDVRSLRHVARLQYGSSLPVADRDEGNVPVFGSNGAVGSHDQAITEAPTIVIGRKGSAGEINYSPEACYPIDTTYFVDARSSDEDLRWLYYCLLSLRLEELSEHSAVPGLTREYVYSLTVGVPTKREQRLIAEFLDHRTGKIDDLIAKKERLIELLEEKRTALITKAVTKGLDPDVSMEDSGVEWLGEIPEHWKIIRLKHLVRNSKDGLQIGPYGSMLTDIYYEEKPYKLYGQENTISGNFEKGSRWLSKEQFAALREYQLRPGDIVLTRKGSIGNAARAPEDLRPGVIDSDTIRVRPREGIDSNFLLRVLRDSAYVKEEVVARRRGAVLSGLNSSTVANLVLAIPPEREQKEIVSYLDSRAKDYSRTIDRITTLCDRLYEYRSALITAAVTGKIDVRDHAA